MRMRPLIAFTICIALGLAACGKKKDKDNPAADEGGGGNNPPGTLTSNDPFYKNALESVPQFKTALALTGTEQLGLLSNFLRFGCHTSDGSTNFCADYGITVTDFKENTYMLSNDNLMGMINLFSMKYDDLFRTGGDLSACPQAQGTRKAPVISGSTSLLIGYAEGSFKDLLVCVGHQSFGAGDAPYVAYSDSSGNHAFITTQMDSVGQGTYLYQGFARHSGTKSQLFAFNAPMMGSSAGQGRILIIGNVETHRFILNSTGTSDGTTATTRGYISFGVGGMQAGGTRVDGRFKAKVVSQGISETFCVNNATQAVETDQSLCSDTTVNKFFAGTATWAEIKTFLGVTAADATYIDGWGAFFASADVLPSSSIPSAKTQFPGTIN